MGNPVIDVDDLHFQYFGNEVLKGVGFKVPAGCVCGLVGENGVGKTTLIKHLLGRRVPQQGTVRVFGCDPVADPAGVLGRIGYLSEDRDLPQWMSVAEFILYIRAFYPNWDDQFASDLQDMFQLPGKSKIQQLSRGQRARIGLLAALAHRPPLLILDEPSSGLDAVVRRDILDAVIRVVADDGRTVFFSSHLLEELQRVSDRIVMLGGGKVRVSGSVDQLLRSHIQVTVSVGDRVGWYDGIPALSAEQSEGDWKLIVRDTDQERLRQCVTQVQGQIVRQCAPTLEELFVALSRERQHEIGGSGIDVPS